MCQSHQGFILLISNYKKVKGDQDILSTSNLKCMVKSYKEWDVDLDHRLMSKDLSFLIQVHHCGNQLFLFFR